MNVLMIILLQIITATSACPDECDCLQHTVVWCDSRSLTSVPIGIEQYTRQLYLFDNNITTIPKAAFSKLQNLQSLVLKENLLRSDDVTAVTFNQLNQLQSLDLSNNQLTIIGKNMFSGMRMLERLYLENNKISYIDRDAFTNMTKLIELKLTNNLLNTFPIIIGCTKLARLYLSHNRINQLYNNFQSVNLEQLEIAGNQLSRVSSGAFKRVSHLNELDLSQNRFTQVPTIVKNMTSLHMLNLSGNPITSLPDNLLTKLRRIKVLDLSNMKLETLKEGFIPRGVWPNTISLSNNPWKCSCDILWITNMMRSILEVFDNANSVECIKIDGSDDKRPLATLTNQEMKCDPYVSHSSIVPIVDGCDGLSCANGGTCVRNRTTGKPTCMCKAGWYGVLCRKKLKVSSTVATSTHRIIGGTLASRMHQQIRDDSQLMINQKTSQSVGIILPNIKAKVKVSVMEINSNERREFFIKPRSIPTYTIDKLKPNKTYSICISSSVQEDTLCSQVTTMTDAMRSQPASTVRTRAFSVKNTRRVENAGGRRQMFEVVYPVLGAVLGVLILIVVAVVVYLYLQDRRKLQEMKEEEEFRYHSSEYHSSPVHTPNNNNNRVDQQYTTISSRVSSIDHNINKQLYQIQDDEQNRSSTYTNASTLGMRSSVSTDSDRASSFKSNKVDTVATITNGTSRSVSGIRGNGGLSSPPTYGFIYGSGGTCHRNIDGQCYQSLTPCPSIKRPCGAGGSGYMHHIQQVPYMYNPSPGNNATLGSVPRPMPLYRPDSGGYDSRNKLGFVGDNKYSTLRHETSSSCSSSNPFDTLDV